MRRGQFDKPTILQSVQKITIIVLHIDTVTGNQIGKGDPVQHTHTDDDAFPERALPVQLFLFDHRIAAVFNHAAVCNRIFHPLLSATTDTADRTRSGRIIFPVPPVIDIVATFSAGRA